MTDIPPAASASDRSDRGELMGTLISENVARLICPEALRMRDEFMRAMDRLVGSTGATGDEVILLRGRALELSNTTGLSAAEAAGHLADLHAAREMMSAIYAPGIEEPPVTDILADIDDTLADWYGSADSMRWRPDPTPEQARRVLVEFTAITMDAFRQLAEQVTVAWQGMQPLLAMFDEIQSERPSALDARYHQRQRNRRRRRR